MQLPVIGWGEQWKMAQVLGTLHSFGDSEEAPTYRIQTAPALSTAAIWEVN